jgi:hypothetical protein
MTAKIAQDAKEMREIEFQSISYYFLFLPLKGNKFLKK